MSKQNFFDQFQQRPDVQQRNGSAVPNRNVPPAESYNGNTRPSPVVPGNRVPGSDTGNHLQDRMNDVDAGGGSPLAQFMKGGHNTKRGGQSDSQGNSAPQSPQSGGQSAAPAQSPAPSIWETSPELFRSAFSQQADSFIPSDITEEEYKKAFSGDFEAFKSFTKKMGVHQASMTAYNQTRITKAGLDKEFESFKGKLPDTMRQHQFSDLFAGVDHPFVSDSTTKPLLKATTQYFREEFPDATPEEIREGVLAYMENKLGSSKPNDTGRPSRNLASHFDTSYEDEDLY
jgi:hypothetical protein